MKFSDLVRDASEKAVQLASEVALAERQSMVIEKKPDGSLVTNADVAVEKSLREYLSGIVPGAGFWGEELGRDEDRPDGLWLIDPIDGTTNFAHRSPLWGISVALCVGNRIIGGAVALPDLREVYSASNGGGAYLNGERLSQIAPQPIERFQPISVNETTSRLPDLPGKVRSSGCFVVDGCFTALGRFRALYGIREQLYDIAACLVITEEVGLVHHYLDGDPLDVQKLKEGGMISRPWVITPRKKP